MPNKICSELRDARTGADENGLVANLDGWLAEDGEGVVKLADIPRMDKLAPRHVSGICKPV